MKKNIMLRLSAVLLVAVLLTTCVISGTWAKYTSTGTATDSARVAKWGVEISAKAPDAKVNELGGGDELEVATDTGVLVLAPGTETTELADITISGDPEVAIQVIYEATLTLTNWKVDVTDDSTDNPVYYCPLVITVNGQEFDGTDYADAAAFKSAVEGKINGLGNQYSASANLSSIVAPTVTVKWAFETGADADEKAANNIKDTALGDAAAAGTGATLQLEIDVTVNQVD